MDEGIAFRLLEELFTAYSHDGCCYQWMSLTSRVCQPCFASNIYYCTIWTTGRDGSTSALKGSSAADVVCSIYRALQDGSCLSSDLPDGKTIAIRLGDGTGVPERFLVGCDLSFPMLREDKLLTSMESETA